MQLIGLGWHAFVLVSASLAAGCAQAVPAKGAPLRPAAPAFSAAAVPACSGYEGGAVWLPGAEQRLDYCDDTLELRDAVSGLVRAQRVMSAPNGAGGSIQSAVVSPDGRHVALNVRWHLEVRELPSLDLSWTSEVRPDHLGFSSDGRELRVGEGTTASAFSVADGRLVTASASRVAQRWQGSPALNADESLAFEVRENKVTVWDPIKDVALRSFEPPKGNATPVWLGPYLGFDVSGEHVLLDARDPQRRFSLKGVPSLREAALSRDGTRLRSARQRELLEWRLGEATPTVLAAPSAQKVWLGPAELRIELADTALTAWRQTAAGERVASRYWARPVWVEVGPAGEVVARDSGQPRLLVLGANSEQDVALQPGEEPSLLAFEPQGGRFVTAAARQLRVYRAHTLEVQQTIELPSAPSALAWRSEPEQLLFADDQRLYSVAPAGGPVTPVGDFAGVLRLAVSTSGKDVAVVAVRDGKPELTLLGGADTNHIALPGVPQDLRFSADGKALWVLERDSRLTLPLPFASSAADAARKNPIKAGGCPLRLAPTGEVYCSSDGRGFAVESGEPLPEPAPVALEPAWSTSGLTLKLASGRQEPVDVSFPAGTAVPQQSPQNPAKAPQMPALAVISGDVRAWALNADRSVLAALDGNASVNTFSATGGLLARLAESASALINSEDASTLLIVATDARSLSVWDTRTWQPRVEVPVVERISQLAVSKDGARVAVLNEHGDLEVVLADRSLRHYPLRHDIGIRGLVFDPSGRYLALGGLPLRILRLSDGAVLYGYAATVDAKEPIALAWISELGAITGDLRALHAVLFPSPSTPGTFLGPASIAKQQAPHVLDAFFAPPAR